MTLGPSATMTRIALPVRALNPRATRLIRRSSSEVADASGHERGAQDQHDDRRELDMDHRADAPPAVVGEQRCLPLPQRRAPFQELHCRVDGEQADEHEERKLHEERHAMEIVARALLEVE